MKKIILAIALMLPATVQATPIIIEGVPSYDWIRGCSPTAAAMIMGYWDNNGYDNLFNSSGDDVQYTNNVTSEINTLADDMSTFSWGGTLTTFIPGGIETFASNAGADISSNYLENTVDSFINEINNGRPVLLNILLDEDRFIDHSIAAFGYNYQGPDLFVYAHTTWYDDYRPYYYKYSDIIGDSVHSILQILPGELHQEVPEPATGLLYMAGLLGLSYASRKGRRNPRRYVA